MQNELLRETFAELQPGTMTLPGGNGEVCLVGGRCENCGTRVFPARERCVSCYGAAVVSVSLDRLGKVDAFTIVRQAPPGYYGPVPYVLGLVVIGNEVTALCHLQGKPVDEWNRGDIVASYAYALPAGLNQQHVLTFAFNPATELDMAEASKAI